ncbi:LCP family protein [Alicyclobacillus cycloheptanicus]|uniref:LCP family protein required for cell wall assembly n=1 Tax=Alicyclobacillus cycloheptanicus TaxID=1457 RepID=A0ABT9XFA8_9BACL|nr:LCP family protein [Alicyclobacillus cycloheptanicus]MDQ0188979.1 LCP family protein required for cell wall assembly [Alicyclobacillus cycloheptanicus]WDM01676.1 LCP family protein [Alicyclobacillus cycloheptanicus]
MGKDQKEKQVSKDSTTDGTAKRHRTRRIVKWSLISLCSLVVLAGAAAACTLYELRPGANTANASAMHKSVTKAVQKLGQTVSGVSGPTNILLIANNARNATNPLSLGTAAGQADILIIAHIDPQKHTVSLISVPRDTLIAMPTWKVPIPKIKTTFTVGLEESPEQGPELAMQYVSKMTGLPIQDYIVTDFQGFADAIDAVGGIQIDVKQRIYDPAHSGANLNPGLQTLNGQEALAFVRVRQNAAGNDYRTNDFERQQAEMQMLEALKTQVLSSAKSPTKLMHLVTVWKKDVATNLTTTQLVGIGMETAGASIREVQIGDDADSMDLASTPAPGINAENYLTGAYYDVLDPAEITKTLAPFGSTGANLGLPPLPDPKDVPVELYGPESLAATLRHAGFPVTYMGPSNGQNTVYYPAGKMTWGWAVARAVGNSNEWVAPSSSSDCVVVDAP